MSNKFDGQSKVKKGAMVPEGWYEGQVSDVVKNLESGVSVSGEDRPLAIGEYGVLRVSAVTYGIFDPASVKAILPHNKEKAKCKPKAGQIVISRSNTDKMVGASAYIEKDYPCLYLSDKLWQTVAKPEASMHWLSYVLSSRNTRNFLSNLATGTSGSMKNIAKSEFLNLRVLVPPYSEQKKIAEILSTWDRAIDATERLLDNSRQRKKALMHQLLTGKKRLPGFGGEWRYILFSEGFLVANRKSSQVKSSGYKGSGNVPVVDQGKEIIAGFCDHQSPYEDVPIIIFGDHTRIVKWIDFPFCPGADGTQVLKARQLLDAKFAYFMLSNIELPNLGYSRHMRELKQCEFRVPVENIEQQAIAVVLTTADEEIASLSRRLEALKQEKKALMQQLLTGKRRVNVDTEAA